MSCKDWEREIYRYDELSSQARQQLETHVRMCNDCEKKLRMFHAWRHVAVANRPQISDPAALTRQIMSRIHSERTTASFPIFERALNHVVTRYALAAMSLLIVGFYTTEFSREIRPVSEIHKVMPSQKNVPLNTANFIRNMKNNRENRTVLSIYDCAKSEQCTHPLVKSLTRKNKS